MAADTPSLLRARGEHEHAPVVSIELLEHLSFSGAIQTLMLFLAVWWLRIFTAWATNWLDPEKIPVW